MKRVRRILKYFCIAVFAFILICLIFPTWTPSIKGENSVSIYKKVSINGTKHQLMIRGKDNNNPILIFVHGGPGCSEIPYVRKYQDILEQKFTIVHYDQRGTGKSFHFFEDYSNLSTELLVDDLIALTEYIREKFDKDKVLLVGHSFGSYIGIQAAAKAPEKYIAYVGIGQVSNLTESETDALNYCLEEAEKVGNNEDITKLKEMKNQVENGQALVPRTYIQKYGGGSRLTDENGDYIEGYLMNPEYNLLDVIRFQVGLRKSLVMIDDLFQNPLSDIVKRLEIPLSFHMGQYDYKTSANSARNYFNSIEADEKEFLLYLESAHYPQFEEEEKFAEWLIEKYSD